MYEEFKRLIDIYNDIVYLRECTIYEEDYNSNVLIEELDRIIQYLLDTLSVMADKLNVIEDKGEDK